MQDVDNTTTSTPLVSPPDPVAEAEARRVSAHAKWERVQRQLRDAEADLRSHQPEIAMRAGRDATEAAAAHAEATARCGYLADAVDHARLIAHEAQQEVERIQSEVIHGPRLRAAITTRLDALKRIWVARSALASAEKDYCESADTIRHAIGSARSLRPAWIDRDGGRIDLPMAPPHPAPVPVYRDLAEEILLWGALGR